MPVVSGNVSLYNETDGRAIPPTPVVGCVGLVADVRARAAAVAGRRRRSCARDAPSALERARGRADPLRRARRAAALARPRRRRPAASRRALVEAARWSGVGAERRRSPRGERRASRARRERVGRLGAESRRARRRRGELRDPGRAPLMCGVFGIRAPGRDVARITYFGLLRAPAPGPGVGRHRGLRPGPADGAARHGPRHAGVRRAEAARPARRARDRPHALLDDRLDALGERAADRPPRRARARSRSATTAT